MAEKIPSTALQLQHDKESLLEVLTLGPLRTKPSETVEGRDSLVVAPEGHYFKITATDYFSLTRTYNMYWFENLKPGGVVYAPQIDVIPQPEARISDRLVTAWDSLPHCTSRDIDSHEVSISSSGFELGLIAVEAYVDLKDTEYKALLRTYDKRTQSSY